MASSTEGSLYRNANLRIIFCVTLMAVMGVASLTPAFPRMARELGLSSQRIGLLITIFTLPGIVMAPVLGVLADRWGRKRILVPSLLLFGLAGGACAFAHDFTLLLTLRFLQGVGASALGALNVTLIGDLFTGRDRAAAMGYNASVLSIGTASYPAIGGLLATFAWYAPFLLPLAAIPVALLVLRLQSPEPRNSQRLGEYLAHAWRSVRSRQVLGLFAASISMFVLLYGAYLTYLPFLMRHSFGAPPMAIGLVMSSISATTALTSAQMGRLTRRFSERTLLKLSFLVYALALAIIPLVDSLWALLLPALITGLAHGLNIPCVQTLLAGLAPLEHRAAFMSINGMVLRTGQTLGPLLMGVVYGWGGMSAPFVAGAVLAVGSSLVLGLVLREPLDQEAETAG